VSKLKSEKYSVLGIISTVLMVISTLPLYISYIAKFGEEVQKKSVYITASGFIVAYIIALIDTWFGKKNKNFSILTLVMETLIIVVIALAYIIL
jgi:hypothetical protein